MKKKLLIISRNNVPTQFWSLFLDLELTTIWKWSRSDSPIPHLGKEPADLILVDDYFGPTIHDEWLEQIYCQIITTGYRKEIFCVSPRFIRPSFHSSSTISGMKCFSFSETFLDCLSEALGIQFQQDEMSA